MLNPEFKRYFLLEMTPFRWVIMPVSLAVIFVCVSIGAQALGLSGADHAQVMQRAATLLYFFMGWIWATRSVARSVLREVREGTWDMQRMSGIGPWRMVWGKIFGATLFPWYGVLICLGVVFYYSFDLPAGEAAAGAMGQSLVGVLMEISQQLSADSGPVSQILVFLGCMLIAHFVSFNIALIWIQKDRSGQGVRYISCVFLGICAALAFLMLHVHLIAAIKSAFATLPGASASPELASSVAQALQSQGGGQLLGYNVLDPEFRLLALVFFVFWGAMGAYRLMRQEMQYRIWPWGWTAFIITLIGYLYLLAWLPIGFGQLTNLFNTTHLVFWIAYIVASFGFWISLFLEPKDMVRYYWLGEALRGRKWALATSLMPAWILPLIFVLLVTLGMMAHQFFVLGQIDTLYDLLALGKAAQRGTLTAEPFFTHQAELLVLIGGATLYLIRDLVLVQAMGFLPKKWRPDILALVVLLTLYILGPAIAAATGYSEARVLMHISIVDPLWLPLLSAILQIGIFAALIHLAWQRLRSGHLRRDEIEADRYGIADSVTGLDSYDKEARGEI